MKRFTLGHNPMVNLWARIIRQANRISTKTIEKILKKMEFQEIVQQNYGNKNEPCQVMRKGYCDRSFENQLVGKCRIFKNCLAAIHGDTECGVGFSTASWKWMYGEFGEIGKKRLKILISNKYQEVEHNSLLKGNGYVLSCGSNFVSLLVRTPDSGHCF